MRDPEAVAQVARACSAAPALGWAAGAWGPGTAAAGWALGLVGLGPSDGPAPPPAIAAPPSPEGMRPGRWELAAAGWAAFGRQAAALQVAPGFQAALALAPKTAPVLEAAPPEAAGWLAALGLAARPVARAWSLAPARLPARKQAGSASPVLRQAALEPSAASGQQAMPQAAVGWAALARESAAEAAAASEAAALALAAPAGLALIGAFREQERRRLRDAAQVRGRRSEAAARNQDRTAGWCWKRAWGAQRRWCGRRAHQRC